MNHNGGTRHPDEILVEINQTRRQMDATLGAIEQRLTPGQLVDQGLAYLRQSGASEFVSNLQGSVKTNPLPVTLVGVGLAWLMAAGSKTPDAQTPGARTMESGKEKLADAAQTARERAGQVGDGARQSFEQIRGGYERLVHEQPLALGAIGLAIGAVLAAAAPRTRQEDELMGGAREQLMNKAGEAAKDPLEKAQAAVTAKEPARKEQKPQQRPPQPQQQPQRPRAS